MSARYTRRQDLHFEHLHSLQSSESCFVIVFKFLRRPQIFGRGLINHLYVTLKPEKFNPDFDGRDHLPTTLGNKEPPRCRLMREGSHLTTLHFPDIAILHRLVDWLHVARHLHEQAAKIVTLLWP